MSEWFSLLFAGLVIGFVGGVTITVKASDTLNKERISAGYFAYDGKPYRVTPITPSEASLTPP